MYSGRVAILVIALVIGCLMNGELGVAVECDSLDDCTIACQYGKAYDENECQICECLEPCKDVSCASDEACEVQEVVCEKAPCKPHGVCVQKPATVECNKLENCTLECQYGHAYDQNECEICQCFEPCKDVICASNEQCEVHEVQCIRAPCLQRGECVQRQVPADCEKLESCTLECQYGLNYDEKECEICECFEPCKDVVCASNEQCEVHEVQCIRAPCPQRGECVQKQDGSTTTQRARDLCLHEPLTGPCKAHMPRWFFNVSALECQQFVYGGCEGNDNNFETRETCLGRCLPSSVICPPEDPCIGPCQIQVNDKGCRICACPGTDCKAMLCKSNEECGMVDGRCDDEDSPCYAVPTCFTKSDVRPTVTPTSVSMTSQRSSTLLPAMCLYSAVAGPCEAQIERWFYNTTSGMCEKFYYGGCNGNENNFMTVNDCVTICTPQKPPCPEIMCDAGCSMKPGSDGCNTCVCDSQCPTIRCSRDCQYGQQKDSKGCNSCDCIDPCMDMQCPSGQTCTYKQYAVCNDDVCQRAFRGQCTATSAECPTLNCTNSCSYGRVKNGKCETCDCATPCKDTLCETGYACKIISALTCLGETCEMKHVGMCRVECPSLECDLPCEFGNVKDFNDCNTCKCFDPCEDVACKEGQVCVKKTIATYVGENDEVKEVFVGQCEEPCARMECDTKCEYGYMKDNNGCEICQCFEPCQNFTCLDSISICQPKKVNVSETQQYEYVGECLRCTGMVCRMACDYGVLMLTQNCPLCECFDPCKDMQCQNPRTCVVREVGEEAESSLQSYIGECVGPAVMYCTAEMNQNELLYADRLQDMPQLNCDSHGYYKPMQCNPSGRCNCTSSDGQKGFMDYSLKDAIELCFPDDKILGRLRILDIVNITKPGTGASFKREISNQLATTLLIDDSKVTVTEYFDGGSIVDFVVADMNSVNMEIAEHILESLIHAENPIKITFNGKVYAARIEYATRSYSTTTSTSSSTVQPTKQGGVSKGLSRAGFLVLVIVLPIVGAILIGSLFIHIYKIYRSTASFEPMSNRSSMSFDSAMEKAEPPKAGYDNANYDSTKVYPISANFYQGSTKA